MQMHIAEETMAGAGTSNDLQNRGREELSQGHPCPEGGPESESRNVREFFLSHETTLFHSGAGGGSTVLRQ